MSCYFHFHGSFIVFLCWKNDIAIYKLFNLLYFLTLTVVEIKYVIGNIFFSMVFKYFIILNRQKFLFDKQYQFPTIGDCRETGQEEPIIHYPDCGTLNYPFHSNDAFIINRYIPKSWDNRPRWKEMSNSPNHNNCRP